MTKNDKIREIGYYWAEHGMLRGFDTRRRWIRVILKDWNPNKALMAYSEEDIEKLYQQTLPKGE